jgi:hypothetical protein
MKSNLPAICLMLIGLAMLPVVALAQDLPDVERTQCFAAVKR